MTITKVYNIQVRKSLGNNIVLDGQFTTVNNKIISFVVANQDILIPNEVGTFNSNTVSLVLHPDTLVPFSLNIADRLTFVNTITNQFNSINSMNDPYYFEGDKQFSSGGIVLSSIPFINNIYPQGLSAVVLVSSINFDSNGPPPHGDTGANSYESIMYFNLTGQSSTEPPTVLRVKVFITDENTFSSSADAITSDFTTDFAVLEKQFQPDFSDKQSNFLSSKAYVDYKHDILVQDIGNKSMNFRNEIRGTNYTHEMIPQQYDNIKKISNELLNLGDSESPNTVYFNIITSFAQCITERQNQTHDISMRTFQNNQRSILNQGSIRESLQSEKQTFETSLNGLRSERKEIDQNITSFLDSTTQARLQTIQEEKQTRQNADNEFQTNLTNLQSTNNTKFANITFDNSQNKYDFSTNITLSQTQEHDLSLNLSENFRLFPTSDFKSLKFQHRFSSFSPWVDVCSLNNV